MSRTLYDKADRKKNCRPSLDEALTLERKGKSLSAKPVQQVAELNALRQ